MCSPPQFRWGGDHFGDEQHIYTTKQGRPWLHRGTSGFTDKSEILTIMYQMVCYLRVSMFLAMFFHVFPLRTFILRQWNIPRRCVRAAPEVLPWCGLEKTCTTGVGFTDGVCHECRLMCAKYKSLSLSTVYKYVYIYTPKYMYVYVSK